MIRALLRRWRRIAYCTRGAHRETVRSTLRFTCDRSATHRYGEIGLVCGDCARVAWVGDYASTNTNRRATRYSP